MDDSNSKIVLTLNVRQAKVLLWALDTFRGSRMLRDNTAERLEMISTKLKTGIQQAKRRKHVVV